MFNSMKSKHDVYTFSIVTNDYNEEIKTPVFYKSVDLFISLATHNPYTANNTQLIECQCVAITDDSTLAKGMIIDNKYSIEFINAYGNETYLYLKEVA